MTSRTPSARAVVLLLLMLPLAGCSLFGGGKDEPVTQGAPAALYERARRSLDNQDFESAIRVYEALVARYPFTAEARQSRLDLIYAYYKGREAESAIDQAETFIRENPTHPQLAYAWYIKGLVDFEREANFIERWFDVDLDARPPQTARRAFESLRRVVQDYPQSEYAHDARRRMIHLRNRLADYDLHVAEHYVKRGAWIAAAQRSDQIVTEYDGAPAVQDALRIMILSYERLEMKELADRARSVYALNYGGEAGSVVPVRKRWYVPWD
jgi:outer membrane protein assembly factor BamD